jgi:hypothetical protein
MKGAKDAALTDLVDIVVLATVRANQPFSPYEKIYNIPDG